MPHAPPTAGKYRLERLLGSGGGGDVWKSWDPELQRWVAVKILHRRDPEETARFRREATTVAQLHHPNIASVFEAGDGFIAMQYVEGPPLDQIGRVEPRVAADWIRQAARGVHYAHQKGIVHRDLKPSNLIFSGEAIYVLDFGLAKSIDARSSLSATGMVIGSPSYMSSEQAMGRVHDVDARTDVYGLGATLFHLLAGRPPFRGANAYEVLQRVVVEDPPRLPGVSRELEMIVLKCLEKDPARRYATAAALADDLERWLSGEPVQAQPPRMLHRVARFVRRRRTGLTAVATVLLAASAALGYAWHRRVVRVQARLAEAEALERAGSIAAARDAYALVRDDPAGREGLDRADRRMREAGLLLDEARAILDRAAGARYMHGARLEDVRPQLEEARARISGSLERVPDSAAAWHLVGMSWELEARREEAESAWRRAIAADPGHAPARFELGRHLLRRSFLLSIGPVERHAERGPVVEALAREGEREIAEAARLGLDDPLQRDIALAMTLYARRDMDALEALAAPAVARHGVRPGIEEILWLASTAARTEADRRWLMAEAGRIAPNHALIRFSEGLVARTAAEAIEGYSAALRWDPALVPAYTNRARGYAELARNDLARADFDRAIELDPADGGGWCSRGAVRIKLGDLEGARSDLDEALKRNSTDARAWTNRGLVSDLQGEREVAMRDYGRAIEADPRHADAWSYRGVTRMKEGDLQGALDDCSTATKLDPQNAGYWNNLGQVLEVRREFHRAEDAYTRAIQTDASFVQALGNRAILRRDLGNLDGAVEDSTSVLRIEPDNPMALLNRAGAFEELGLLNRAREDARRCIEAAPEGWPFRFLAVDLLNRLGS